MGFHCSRKRMGTKQWLDSALAQSDGNMQDSLYLCCSPKLQLSIRETETKKSFSTFPPWPSADKMTTKVVPGSSLFRIAKSTWF